jgi:hypothetical protein
MPIKRDSAFKKDSEEATRLATMFINGEIRWDAQPKDVLIHFPTLAHYPTDSFRNGFNRVRANAQNVALCKTAIQPLKRGKFG